MPSESSESPAACPVDDRTREAWLAAAKAKGQSGPAHPPRNETPIAAPMNVPASRYSLDTGRWESLKFFPTHSANHTRLRKLGTEREISTIPRAIATSTDPPLSSAAQAALPANSEHDTGHDTRSGNWVYPSQEMFFSAMKRKGHDADPSDMASIVPIHNAVNERAWTEIKAWEVGQGAENCGGPKLVSFSGDSKALTPRARWNVLIGYHPPFDRHDWTIDRCGTRVDYVIDFYSGKGGDGLKGLNFYLDVRPKLNSLEGFRMRASKALGL